MSVRCMWWYIYRFDYEDKIKIPPSCCVHLVLYEVSNYTAFRYMFGQQYCCTAASTDREIRTPLSPQQQ